MFRRAARHLFRLSSARPSGKRRSSATTLARQLEFRHRALAKRSRPARRGSTGSAARPMVQAGPDCPAVASFMSRSTSSEPDAHRDMFCDSFRRALQLFSSSSTSASHRSTKAYVSVPSRATSAGQPMPASWGVSASGRISSRMCAPLRRARDALAQAPHQRQLVLAGQRNGAHRQHGADRLRRGTAARARKDGLGTVRARHPRPPRPPDCCCARSAAHQLVTGCLTLAASGHPKLARPAATLSLLIDTRCNLRRPGAPRPRPQQPHHRQRVRDLTHRDRRLRRRHTQPLTMMSSKPCPATPATPIRPRGATYWRSGASLTASLGRSPSHQVMLLAHEPRSAILRFLARQTILADPVGGRGSCGSQVG